eukprot:s2996_g11.t4
MAAEGPGLENGCPLSQAQTHQGSDVADVNQDGKAVSFDDGGQGHFVPVGAVAVSAGAAVVLLVVVAKAESERESGPVVRKGTGFEEEGSDSQRHVAFDPSAQAGTDAGPAVRRGTGFVGIAELPSDDDDEEAAQQHKDNEPAGHRVAFDPGTQEGSGGLVAPASVRASQLWCSARRIQSEARVKTGAVTTRMEGPDSPQGHGRLQVNKQKTSRLASGDLAQLSSDEEVAESQPAKVSFDPAEEKPEIPKTGTKVTSRKGTGFLRKEDLQDLASEEEEQEEADEAQQMAHGDRAVSFEPGSQIQESEDQPRRVVARKGTGFLHAGDVENLVGEEDEEEEEEEEAGRRKEEEPDSQRHVAFDPSTQAGTDAAPAVRRGTGFVGTAELPSDDEEAAQQHKELGRKGTGFLRKEDVADLVDQEEEEEEDEPGSSEAGRRKVGFEKPSEEAEAEGKSKPVARKGTGFVNVGDLPSDDEDRDTDDRTTTECCKKTWTKRRTSPVLQEDVDQEEDEPGSSEAGRRKVGFEKPSEEAQTEREGKPVARKGTGFVNVGDLPSDDEDRDATRRKHSSGSICLAGTDAAPAVRRGTGFVGIVELPSDDDEEDNEPAGHRVAFDPGTQEGSGGLVALASVSASQLWPAASYRLQTRDVKQPWHASRSDQGPDSPQGHGRLQVNKQKTSRLASGDLAQLSSDEEVDAAGELAPAGGLEEDKKPEIPATSTKAGTEVEPTILNNVDGEGQNDEVQGKKTTSQPSDAKADVQATSGVANPEPEDIEDFEDDFESDSEGYASSFPSPTSQSPTPVGDAAESDDGNGAG